MTPPLLQDINSPKDLKKLKPEELSQLSEELRDAIISTVSKTGGHLASSLGVVELTIALHYLFDAPVDKIIWDVGHQAYAHKLLTGRRDSFHTLRQEGGISGFPKRDESEYDCFDVGHSSTSISAALGMAKARDLRGDRNKVIAVIGDGSMTAGLAFEGLNHAGHLDTDLIVILNDNEMSISQNVGGLSSYLNRIMTGHFYNKFRKETESFLKHIPKFGGPMLELARKAEESFKNLIVPGMLFEELGFKYFGPIDGHDLNSLMETLSNIKDLNGPILLHVITRKGKGYKPAEERPDEFHGVGSFDIATGKATKLGDSRSFTDVFGDAIVELAREDDGILAITASMPQGTGLEKFGKEFPARFFDVGIAEQHAFTFAAGLACEGYKPVVALYSTFLQRAYDQVLHDVCLQKLPVVMALDRGGIVGADGPTHHGLFDFSFLRHIPNMVVMAPKDEEELRRMLKSAFSFGLPASIRYPRGSVYGVKADKEVRELEIGKGEVLRDGEDVCIVAIGSTVYPAIIAAQELEKEGIKAAVINARFVKPLDADLITDMAGKTGKIITVEENVLQGGFGSAILEMLEEKGISGIKVKRLGIPDKFVEHGGQDALRKRYGIDKDGIVKAVRELNHSE
ncbi:MAG: 1-deoxy-D-xylulose-5-phosphate synthase [Deltaproteobacteria bacterium]|nr:1-deoxy-D-xylulose-5-phosphate synthase [Deltaproteobacteria bacterium]